MKNKKAASQVMWIIVTALLALLILIILLMIFGGKAGLFNSMISDCKKAGGQPTDFDKPCDEKYPYTHLYITSKDKKCCVKNIIGGSEDE
jgi:hypothetical protein